MRKLMTAAMAAVGVMVSVPVWAQTRVIVEATEQPTFEVGVQAGFPTGLSMKAWLSRQAAIQAGLAWQPAAPGLIGTIDGVVHTESLVNDPTLRLPLYAGLGLRAINFDDSPDMALGPRVPIGIQAIF